MKSRVPTSAPAIDPLRTGIVDWSDSVASALSGATITTDELADGMKVRLADITYADAGWFTVAQAGVVISCVVGCSYGSSYFRDGDANAASGSLRIYALDSGYYQMHTVSESSRHRVMQLTLEPTTLLRLAEAFGQDGPSTLAAFRRAAGSDESFAVTNHPLPFELRMNAEALLSCPMAGAARRMFIYGKSMELLAYAMALVVPSEEQAIDDQPCGPLDRARALLDENLADNAGIGMVANRVGMGEDTLRRHFKARFGMTLSQHRARARMAEAHRLLALGELRVSEVATLVGFSNHAAFTRAFAKHHGYPPSFVRQSGESLPSAATNATRGC